MNIYMYDKKTLEYLGTKEADKDPEETKTQGHFVPLVPACATLIEPPQYGENEIPVFEENSWVIYPDLRTNFRKINSDLSVEKILTIGNQEGALIVSKDIADAVSVNPELFKITNNKVVPKSSAEIEQEKYNSRKNEFEREFFETSLGWIRRKVRMKDGAIKDFLSDLLLQIKAGIEMGQDVRIITYKLPDFSEESTTESLESLQEKKPATLNFVKECLNQIVKDFGE